MFNSTRVRRNTDELCTKAGFSKTYISRYPALFNESKGERF